MTLSHYVLRPRLRDLLLQFLVHKNPFYLLSAELSMIAGCFAINSDLSPHAGALIAHLGMLHWVYNVDFVAADLSPIFLGAAVAAHRAIPAAIVPRALALLMAALLSVNQPGLFAVHLTGKWILTPGLLMTAASYLAFVYTLRLRHAVYFLFAGFLVVMFIWTAPMLLLLSLICRDGMRKGIFVLQSALPKTSLQWGMTALVGAFAFLGFGAALSLRHAPPEEAPEPPTAT